jgi:restriction endonuclease Mrr
VAELVARKLGLPDDTIELLNKSGQSRFRNDVAWARYYLAEGGRIDSSRRGVWNLTEKGRNAPDLTDDDVNELRRVGMGIGSSRLGSSPHVREGVICHLATRSSVGQWRASGSARERRSSA